MRTSTSSRSAWTTAAIWLREGFGPFLVETDERGRVLRSEVHLPNVVLPGSTSTGAEVMSPQNPFLGSLTPNLNGSNGFEGMAVSPSGRFLFPLLEGTVAGDDSVNGTVRKRHGDVPVGHAVQEDLHPDEHQ